MKQLNQQIIFAIFLVALAALSRLLPHPPNFAPIAAMALFAGAIFPNRSLAFAVPLLAMLISDLFIGLHSQLPVVYLAMALTVMIGSSLQSKLTLGRLTVTTLSATGLFFVLTNFSVWLVDGLYPLTAAGLVACYVAAIPFLQNTLAGDVVFVGLLFGVWYGAKQVNKQPLMPV